MQTPPIDGEQIRFYQLVLQEDLLGGWTLIKQYGYSGHRGSHKQQHFDDYHAAQKALDEEKQKQSGKGFRIMYLEGRRT